MAMIAVRLFGGSFRKDEQDRCASDRPPVPDPCFIALPHAVRPSVFYLLAGVYGLSLGVSLPLLTACFLRPLRRPCASLNTNLSLFTLDMAYFLMPYLCGIALALCVGLRCCSISRRGRAHEPGPGDAVAAAEEGAALPVSNYLSASSALHPPRRWRKVSFSEFDVHYGFMHRHTVRIMRLQIHGEIF